MLLLSSQTLDNLPRINAMIRQSLTPFWHASVTTDHSSKRVSSLQALRAIAASLVVFSHSITTYMDKIGDLGFDFNQKYGGLGVKIFFCISGYIIYKTTQTLPNGRDSVIDFMVRRMIRIVPIYWVATLFYSIKLSLQGNMPTIQELTSSLLFIPYISDTNGQMRPVLGVGWTLNYEMLFYFVLAVSIFLPSKKRIYSVTIALIGFQMYFALFPVSRELYSTGYDLLATSWLTFFILGMCIAHIKISPKLQNFYLNDTLIIALLPLIIVGYFFIDNVIELSVLHTMIAEFTLALFCVFLCAFSQGSCENQSQAKKTSWLKKAAILAGDGSYSTYLFHCFLLGAVARFISKFGIDINPFVFAAVMTILSTIAGALIYRNFEKIITQRLNNNWKSYRNASRRIFVYRWHPPQRADLPIGSKTSQQQ